MSTGIGGHQSAAMRSNTWITPRNIIERLGGADSFDLDPCAAPSQPWPCARRSYTVADDGLAQPWEGRCWVNPPYGRELEAWMKRLADHGQGTALIFARTETAAFFETVWRRATALLFLSGRLHFHYEDGRRAAANGGAPSVLIAYGLEDADILAECEIDGAFVPLSSNGQTVVVLRHGVPELSWTELLTEIAVRQGGTLDLAMAYALVRNHPKARRNPNWRAKVRQSIARAGFDRIAPGQYALPMGAPA